MGDIVFLVDGSSSIGTSNFQEVRLFLRSLVSDLDIGPGNIQVGLAQYSSDPQQEFLLKDHAEKTALLAAIDSFPYKTGGTETGKAIDFLRTQYFSKEAGSRADQRVPQIAVVITDGDSTDDVVEPAKKLRKHGVIVFAIGVGNANQRELDAIANRPSNRFRFTIDSFQALQRLRDQLLQTMCVSIEDKLLGESLGTGGGRSGYGGLVWVWGGGGLGQVGTRGAGLGTGFHRHVATKEPPRCF